MIRYRQSSPAFTAMILIIFAQLAPANEPAKEVVQPRDASPRLQFTFFCVRPCDCGKPLCGISCRAPAFTCCDDYCRKPLPRVSLCWPIARCDDYCSKPLPCWPPDPCACKPVQALSSAEIRASCQQSPYNTTASTPAAH